MPMLLFLCTGNYYRSRFAEHLFNARVQPLNLPWVAESRGLAIELGIHNVGPIAPVTIKGLATRGIAVASPLRGPAQARDHDFAGADRIIALYEREHQPLVAQRFPAWAQRVEYWQVPDLGDLGANAALKAIEREVSGLIQQLRSGLPH
ncbi:MAG: low molecular weight phosphatase family protein [Chloroflexales bacterium]|nr:low molecular weight phosphatase family protein [Chloroflexales bacterium]